MTTLLFCKVISLSLSCVCGGTAAVAFKLGDWGWGWLFVLGTIGNSYVYHTLGAAV